MRVRVRSIEHSREPCDFGDYPRVRAGSSSYVKMTSTGLDGEQLPDPSLVGGKEGSAASTSR